MVASAGKLGFTRTLVPRARLSKLILIVIGALTIGLLVSTFLVSSLINRDQWLNAQLIASYLNQGLVENTTKSRGPGQSIYAQLFERIRRLRHVTSLTVYSKDQHVLWSSQAGKTGGTLSKPAFDRALDGQIELDNTHTAIKANNIDKLLHRFYMRWVPTAYIPIIGPSGRVNAVAEVSRLPLFLFQQLSMGLLLFWSTLSIATVIFIALSYRLSKQTSHQLISCEVDLEKSRRLAEVGECVSMIVHDTRNLMASIRFVFERLRSGKLNDNERQKMIQRATRPLEMSFAMMEDLLGFVSGKKTPLACHKYNLKQLLDEGQDMLSAMLEASGHQLKIEVPEDVIIYWDSQKLLHILVNLVRNSAEAMETPGTVTIEAKRGDGGVQLYVRDTGSGIPKELLPTLFEPFVSESGKARPGLGLAIIRDLVRRHGGEVSARNRREGGAEFDLFFPDCPFP